MLPLDTLLKLGDAMEGQPKGGGDGDKVIERIDAAIGHETSGIGDIGEQVSGDSDHPQDVSPAVRQETYRDYELRQLFSTPPGEQFWRSPATDPDTVEE